MWHQCNVFNSNNVWFRITAMWNCGMCTVTSSFCWSFRHRLNWKSSNWQLPMHLVTKISLKCRYCRFDIYVLFFSVIDPNVDVSQTSAYNWRREPIFGWFLRGRAYAQRVSWALPGVVHHASPVYRCGNRRLWVSYVTNNTNNFVSRLYSSQVNIFECISMKITIWWWWQ